jgi:hypothetical protein
MAQTIFVKAARKFAGKCEVCFREIDKGSPYKWIGVKRPGAALTERRVRCGGCDDWHEWDYNPSIPAQCRRVAHDTEWVLSHGSYTTPREAREIMSMAAQEVEIFANTREVSADRARRVFGPNNFKVKQFESDTKLLRMWARFIRDWKPPKLPDPELTECDMCDLRRSEIPDSDCPTCHGAGEYVPEWPTSDQLDEWRSDLAESASETLEMYPL